MILKLLQSDLQQKRSELFKKVFFAKKYSSKCKISDFANLRIRKLAGSYFYVVHGNVTCMWSLCTGHMFGYRYLKIHKIFFMYMCMDIYKCINILFPYGLAILKWHNNRMCMQIELFHKLLQLHVKSSPLPPRITHHWKKIQCSMFRATILYMIFKFWRIRMPWSCRFFLH